MPSKEENRRNAARRRAEREARRRAEVENREMSTDSDKWLEGLTPEARSALQRAEDMDTEYYEMEAQAGLYRLDQEEAARATQEAEKTADRQIRAQSRVAEAEGNKPKVEATVENISLALERREAALAEAIEKYPPRTVPDEGVPGAWKTGDSTHVAKLKHEIEVLQKGLMEAREREREAAIQQAMRQDVENKARAKVMKAIEEDRKEVSERAKWLNERFGGRMGDDLLKETEAEEWSPQAIEARVRAEAEVATKRMMSGQSAVDPLDARKTGLAINAIAAAQQTGESAMYLTEMLDSGIGMGWRETPAVVKAMEAFTKGEAVRTPKSKSKETQPIVGRDAFGQRAFGAERGHGHAH
jgi:hypothetical protein